MPDADFFKRRKAFSLQEIADITGAQIHGDADASLMLETVAPLDAAGAGDLSFLDNKKYKDQFTKTNAGACFVKPDLVDLAPSGVALLVTPVPYKSYALAAQAFYPVNDFEPEISKQACIHKDAKIGDGCRIDPMVVIEVGVEIGDHCWIESGAVIGAHVKISNHVRVGKNASVSHALISDYVRLYPGVCIGQDGFGFAFDPSGYVKVPQLGRVIIESHVEIGANTTIDRGAGPDTVIGQGTWIDNLVQIGHNVKIGKGCIFVSQSGVSGSTVIGDYVAVGGQTGIAGHLSIGTGARIAAKSGVMKDVSAGQEIMGYPALPMRDFMKQIATLKRLIQKPKKA